MESDLRQKLNAIELKMRTLEQKLDEILQAMRNLITFARK